MVLTSLGQIGPYIAPFTLGALVKGMGLSTQAAAIAISVEIGCAALTLMGLSRILGSLNFRSVVLAGAILAACGQILTLLTADYALMLAARAVTGIGNGAAIAIAYAIIAGSSQPARLFFYQAFGLALVILIVFLILPTINDAWGPRGQFLTLGVLSLTCVPLALVIRNVPVGERVKAGRGKEKSGLWLLSVACVALFGAASNALWVHYEGLGEHRHLSYETLLLIPSVTGFFFLLLPYISLLIFQRFRSFAPICIANLLQIGFSGIYLLVPDQAAFIVAITGQNILIVFQLTYARMLAGELDPTGRVAAGVGGADFLGSFAGPLVGGAFVIAAVDNSAFFATVVVMFVLSAGISFVALRRSASLLRPAAA